MSKLKVGVQLYTLRDLTAQDMAGTLCDVARLGYGGVEFAGYGGMQADELKSLLDELGLAAIGSHISIDRLSTALEEEIAYNKRIGNDKLVVPYIMPDDRLSEENWAVIAERLKDLGTKCEAQGMKLLYHNHDFELIERLDGIEALDALRERIPANLLAFEIDACWVHYAGSDPAAYMSRYAGRLPLVHMKDYIRNPDGSPLTVELGRGVVGLESAILAASEIGAEWIIVEQDVCTNPPLQSIETSMAWLREYAKRGGEVDV